MKERWYLHQPTSAHSCIDHPPAKSKKTQRNHGVFNLH